MPSIIEITVYRFYERPEAADNKAASLAGRFSASYVRNLASIEFD
ncbi:hypothetical protein [Pseudogemmobacter faecipullorum]|nr:hypothetical protein [Pseudogemmobacter faecipullorum]